MDPSLHSGYFSYYKYSLIPLHFLNISSQAFSEIPQPQLSSYSPLYSTMTTIVFQELQSCTPESMHLTLKLNPVPLTITKPSNASPWGGIQSLSKITMSSKGSESKDSYGRSLSVLSEKSLKMCTENLGSETGSDVSDIDILSWTTGSSTEDPESPTARERRRPSLIFRGGSCKRELPPPLTTSIEIRPRRENGRLVMEAYSAPPRHSYFHAERSDGRLTLSIMRDNDEVKDVEDEEEMGDEVVETTVEVEDELEMINEITETTIEMVEEEMIDEVATLTMELVQEEYVDEELAQMLYADNNVYENRGKMGMMGYERRGSTCKESGRRSDKIFINWESFWVAIS